MASVVAICNLALSHLGISSTIASLTERSKEALACAAFYDQARDETLRDFPWPFATLIADLALVEAQPNIEWSYSYRYPSDCVNFRRILSGITRVSTRDTRVPYRVIADSAGQLILTGQPTAQAEWTVRADNSNIYPADFTQTLALLLAGYLAPRVTAGDQFKLGARALQLYEWRRVSAQANALDEEQRDDPPESDLIACRDGLIAPLFQTPRLG